MVGIEELIRRMPKVELHVKLEGAVRPKTLLRLADRHGVSLPADTEAGLARWYRYTSYTHFLEVALTVNSCIRTPEDTETVVRDFLIGQWQERIFYSEVFLTPRSLGRDDGRDFHKQIDGINRVRAWAARELGVGMGIVVEIPRQTRQADAEEIARRATERRGDGVVALGLGGPDDRKPAGEFAEAFEIARDSGLATVIHAGETAGPDCIWQAIEAAAPSRIQHGLSAVEDPDLLAYLAEGGPAVTVAPSCNLSMGVVERLEDHPAGRLLASGTKISLSSVWPCLVGTSLTTEFFAAYRAFSEQWGRRELVELVMNGVDAALLPPHDKAELRRRYRMSFDELTADVFAGHSVR